jgi:hypothetical protein
MVHMPEPRPWYLLDHTPTEYLKKSGVLVGDPEIPGFVLCDGSNSSGYCADRNIPAIVEIPEPKRGGNPNSPGIILKERIRFEAAADNCNLSAIPPVQAIRSGHPNTAGFVRKNRLNPGTRQTLVHGKCSHSEIAKTIETASCPYPDIAFAILEKDVTGRA